MEARGDPPRMNPSNRQKDEVGKIRMSMIVIPDWRSGFFSSQIRDLNVQNFLVERQTYKSTPSRSLTCYHSTHILSTYTQTIIKMRAAFSIFATLACAAVSFAAPVNVGAEALNGVVGVGAKVDLPVALPPAGVAVNANPVAAAAVSTRDAATVPDIIQDLTTSLQPLVAQLNSFTTENISLSVVQPILEDVKGVLNTAITDVQALAGQPVNTLLQTVNGVLSLTDVIGLLTTVISLVFGAVHTVLTLVNGLTDANVITSLLGEVVALVGQLLQVLVGVVGGLLGLVVPLLTPVLTIVSQLGVTQAFSGLGLPL
ncbi:hypothetical protein D9758_014930 [Tetrapyrgos nigripes]|uniref:Uncharacterized protein n=1 Tax=Tetrapyrgos nigripes TaxID=182062 RepID=A0A8H5FI36_9AGAR|nr:hypothetical protein D9758_014930 [Tetrapyrgos nigripes]